jgi:hypothetical protein
VDYCSAGERRAAFPSDRERVHCGDARGRDR